MYGTIARMQVNPGMEDLLLKMSGGDGLKIAGHVSTTMYRMDGNQSDYYMVVAFESKDAYMKNADSPDQDARYRELLTLLTGEPEWHDGEIVYSYAPM